MPAEMRRCMYASNASGVASTAAAVNDPAANTPSAERTEMTGRPEIAEIAEITARDYGSDGDEHDNQGSENLGGHDDDDDDHAPGDHDHDHDHEDDHAPGVPFGISPSSPCSASPSPRADGQKTSRRGRVSRVPLGEMQSRCRRGAGEVQGPAKVARRTRSGRVSVPPLAFHAGEAVERNADGSFAFDDSGSLKMRSSAT